MGNGLSATDGDPGTGVAGGVGVRVATAAMAAAEGRTAGVGVGVTIPSAARPGEICGAGGATGAAYDGAATDAGGGAFATAGELSDGVANADCTTPAEALVTITGNVPPAMAITAPHTEQRARTPLAGTFAGSTRNTERQSGQATVIESHSGWPSDWTAHHGARMLPRPFRSQ